MTAWLSNFLTGLFELFPSANDSPFGFRSTSPVAGTRYVVRRRALVQAIVLPLTPTSRRIDVALPPTTRVFIHPATRGDESFVYAQVDSADPLGIFSASARADLNGGECLIEIPRSLLQSNFMRG